MLNSAKAIVIAGLAFALLGICAPAWAAGTPEQAKALAEKAAVLVAKEGDKAFPALNDPKGEYVEGDLYVAVLDRQGNVHANANPKLIGLNLWEATDPDGVKFTQEIVKVGDASGTGWVSYKFTNPATKKIEPKKTWVHKVGEYVVLCGAYVSQ